MQDNKSIVILIPIFIVLFSCSGEKAEQKRNDDNSVNIVFKEKKEKIIISKGEISGTWIVEDSRLKEIVAISPQEREKLENSKLEIHKDVFSDAFFDKKCTQPSFSGELIKDPEDYWNRINTEEYGLNTQVIDFEVLCEGEHFSSFYYLPLKEMIVVGKDGAYFYLRKSL